MSSAYRETEWLVPAFVRHSDGSISEQIVDLNKVQCENKQRHERLTDEQSEVARYLYGQLGQYFNKAYPTVEAWETQLLKEPHPDRELASYCVIATALATYIECYRSAGMAKAYARALLMISVKSTPDFVRRRTGLSRNTVEGLFRVYRECERQWFEGIE